jgi:protocatechuate 3,4-dioxygenase beta subunit
MVDLWAVDANGAEVANAEVAVTVSNGSKVPLNRGRRPPQTDSRGYILLGGLRATTSRYQISVKHPDFAPQSVAVRLKNPNVIPQMTVKLERGRQVRGYVEYADGVPAADLAITAQIASGYTIVDSVDVSRVDPNGEFTINHVVPGLYYVTALRDGQELPGPRIAYVELPPSNGEPLVLHLKQKSPQSLASISGKLIYVGPNKPRYVSIHAICTPYRTRDIQVNMDRDGQLGDTFVIDRLEPGEYQLTLSGDNVERTVIDNVKAPSEGLQIQVVPFDGADLTTLAGTVLDAKSGKPVTSYKISATRLASFPSLHEHFGGGTLSIEDEQGQFHFDSISAGVYELRVEADGYAPKVSDPISTKGADPVYVFVSAGGAIKGYVADGSGKPVTGAKIVPLSKAGGRYGYVKDIFLGEDGATESVRGEFTLRNLSPGMETLRISYPNLAPTIIKDIAVADGRTTDGVSVVLGKGAAVEGFVYDEQGKPLANEALSFQSADMHRYNGNDPPLADAVTDESGFYHVEGLPEQLCCVSRDSTSSASCVVQRTVLPAAGSTTRLDFGGNPVVTGALVVDGTPPAKARLRLESAEHPLYYDYFAASAVTDDHGRFAFRGVVPGTYAVYFDSSGAQVTKFAVNAADVDLGRIDCKYKTPRLLINVNWPTGWSPGHINSIILWEDGPPFIAGTPISRGEPPDEVGQPWIVEYTHPGTHYIMASSRVMMYCKPVVLKAGIETRSVSLDIPKGTGVVTGYIRNAMSASWDPWMRRTEPNSAYAEYGVDIDAAGQFSIGNLPAGHYRLGSRFAAQYDLPALMEFDLADGQVKVIDFDLSACIPTKVGLLVIQVIDENGCRRSDARVAVVDSNNVARPLKSIEGSDVLAAEPDTYTISVDVPGYRPANQDVTLKPYDLTNPREQEKVIRIER